MPWNVVPPEPISDGVVIVGPLHVTDAEADTAAFVAEPELGSLLALAPPGSRYVNRGTPARGDGADLRDISTDCRTKYP